MFKKVLIADDLGSINQGVLTILNNLGINNVKQVQYCDDAFLKIKKAIIDKEPFDLLITDLSFKADHREQTIDSGERLIEVLRHEYPNLKIIVYSIDDRLQKVRLLVSQFKIDGYVCKGRRGLEELTMAIESVYTKKLYLSPQVGHALSHNLNLDIDDYDISLISHISQGLSQEDISQIFKEKRVSPSSLSSIEKKLNKLKIQFDVKNTIHLVATAKDLGLI
jgi:DNA-binding NarL/FixJ family response regulator